MTPKLSTAAALLLPSLIACQPINPDGHDKLDPILTTAAADFQGRWEQSNDPGYVESVEAASDQLAKDLAQAIESTDGNQCVKLEWTSREIKGGRPNRDTWVHSDNGHWSIRRYENDGDIRWQHSSLKKSCSKDSVNVKFKYIPVEHSPTPRVDTDSNE